MEKITLSIEQWAQLTHGEKVNAPVWLHVTGNSMLPFIRAFRDEVMIVSVPAEAYRPGDIVLFPAKRRGGDYCLHRLCEMDGDRVRTMGDGCRYPDGWIEKDALLGKAVLIRRGNKTIDCESPEWVRRFRIWGSLGGFRQVLLFPLRAAYRLRRLLGKSK